MFLQQNHLRGLSPFVGASVMTTQRNLIEVDASGMPLGALLEYYSNTFTRQGITLS